MTGTGDLFAHYLRRAPLSLAIVRAAEAEGVRDVAKAIGLGDVDRWPAPILDLCCGFGEFARPFFNGVRHAVGLDISRRDLRLAARKPVHAALTCADARALPFPDASFGTVLSVCALEHIPDPGRVLAEVRRILKPGGTILFTVPTRELDRRLLLSRLGAAVGGDRLGQAYARLLNRAFSHANVIEAEEWLRMTTASGLAVERADGLLTTAEVLAYDLALPFAAPSQALRIVTGWRLSPVTFLLSPLLRRMRNGWRQGPKTRGHLLVAARKP